MSKLVRFFICLPWERLCDLRVSILLLYGQVAAMSSPRQEASAPFEARQLEPASLVYWPAFPSHAKHSYGSIS